MKKRTDAIVRIDAISCKFGAIDNEPMTDRVTFLIFVLDFDIYIYILEVSLVDVATTKDAVQNSAKKSQNPENKNKKCY